MGITIQAYRCRIGTFLPKSQITLPKNTYKFTTTNENFPTDFTKAYLVLATILLASSIFPLAYQVKLKTINPSYNHPLYPDTSYSTPHLFNPSNSMSGKTSTDIACNFILSYGMNTLAATVFRMVTNFQSRYLNRRK